MPPPNLPLMNGADNEPRLPRAVVEYLKQLDRWARLLDGQVVRWGAFPPGGAYIQSPTILAGQIKNIPSGSKAGMSEDFLHQLGQVTDTNGTVRVQWGNLPANGASPAQFGYRTLDASGNPVADSLGIVQGWTGQGAASGTPTITATTDTLIASQTFSVSRTQRLFLFYRVTAGTNAASTAFFHIYVDGVKVWANIIQFAQSVQVDTASVAVSTLVAAGSHSYAAYGGNGSPGGSTTVFDCTLDGYTLGVS